MRAGTSGRLGFGENRLPRQISHLISFCALPPYVVDFAYAPLFALRIALVTADMSGGKAAAAYPAFYFWRVVILRGYSHVRTINCAQFCLGVRAS